MEAMLLGIKDEHVVYHVLASEVQSLRRMRNDVARNCVGAWSALVAMNHFFPHLQELGLWAGLILGLVMIRLDGYWFGRLREATLSGRPTEAEWAKFPGALTLEDIRRGFLGVTTIQWLLGMGSVVWLTSLASYYWKFDVNLMQWFSILLKWIKPLLGS